MFGYGLLVFIINIILVSITNKTELTIILNIAVGLLVNRLYISFANSKIAIIKQNNLEKSNEELKNICTNKGGTSIFLPFLGIIVEIIISIIIFMILGLIGITTMFGSLLNSATSAKNGTFNGIFEYESGIKIEDEFTVTVPNRFENDSEDYIFSYRYESGNGVFNGCKFYLSPIRGYSNSQNLINQMIEYYKDSNPTPISQSTINGIKWDSFSKENELGKDYYYATIKNNQVYLIQYGIGKDTNSECDSYRMQIINSIRSK